jgi:hypothetical protein
MVDESTEINLAIDWQVISWACAEESICAVFPTKYLMTDQTVRHYHYLNT